jgi:eukaryotic-like serine/threonine-protein kinase
MISEKSTQRAVGNTSIAGDREFCDVFRVADEIKKHWQAGEEPDVAASLERYPELRNHRTVVLDLAYQEYQRRLRAGEKIDAEAFSRRFPSFQKSLRLFIAVHSFLADSDVETQESLWPLPGEPYLQFNLIAEIGRGAFGRVFLATEPALGNRQVVVKVAPHGGEEADILGKLRHSNIVPVYSLREDENNLTAFCMPFLGYATLSDVLDRVFADSEGKASRPERASIILEAVAAANAKADLGHFPAPDDFFHRASYVDGVVFLAAQLADALAYAHGRGICHRDLKPSNVLMTPDGRPLLLDFNLSVDQEFSTAKIGGTVPFMAPEELAAIADQSQSSVRHRYDPRSDVFSLGVVIYELLTGKLPFGPIPEGHSLQETAKELYHLRKEGIHPLRNYNNQVDNRLAHIVEQCLAFEPDQRPETAQKLADALHKECSWGRRLRRWAGNHPKLVGSMLAASMIVTVAVGLFFVVRPPYGVRQYRLGLACNEQKNFIEAIGHFNNALLVDPNSADALFARGLAFLRQEKYQAAAQDFNMSNRSETNPFSKACEGFCLNQTKTHRSAIIAYQAALETGYTHPALLFNNIGYSYLILRRYEDAEKYLKLAVQADDRLQTPHYNLMQVFIQHESLGKPISAEAFVQANKAVEIGPPSAALFRDVALLYAVAAKRDSKFIELTLQYIKKSVDLGCSPKEFLASPSFSHLNNATGFQEALTPPSSVPSPSITAQVLNPLDVP